MVADFGEFWGVSKVIEIIENGRIFKKISKISKNLKTPQNHQHLSVPSFTDWVPSHQWYWVLSSYSATFWRVFSSAAAVELPVIPLCHTS